MKMVLETIEGEQARLISDVPHFPPVHVKRKVLPACAQVGDVFDVEMDSSSCTPVKVVWLQGEREKRLERIKKKRDALLKRRHEK